MNWYLIALASCLFGHTLTFGICWFVLRFFRTSNLGSVFVAFCLSWFALPVVMIVLGTNPKAFVWPQLPIWSAVFSIAALLLLLPSKTTVKARSDES